MQVSDRYLRHESVLEAFLVNTMTMPLHEAIEQTIGITMKATSVTLWQDIPSLHLLYSLRLGTTVTHSSGLVGYTFFSREVVKTEAACTHPSYSEDVDAIVVIGKTPVLLFPLWDSNNNVCAVVEVTREPSQPFFDDEDEDFVQFFIQKFKVYSYWLFLNKHPHDDCLELMQVMELEQFLLVFQRKIRAMFQCASCELWKYNMGTQDLLQYKKTVNKIDPKKAGIVGEALWNKVLADGGDFRKYAPDGVHPNDTGYAIYTECLLEQMTALLEKPGEQLIAYAIPRQFSEKLCENADLLDCAALPDYQSEGFTLVEESLCDQYPHYIEATGPGASFSFTFTGTDMGFYWMMAKDSGDVIVSIDDRKPFSSRSWDHYCRGFNRIGGHIVVRDLPATLHHVTVTVSDALSL